MNVYELMQFLGDPTYKEEVAGENSWWMLHGKDIDTPIRLIKKVASHESE